jgi:hypothetical protein
MKHASRQLSCRSELCELLLAFEFLRSSTYIVAGSTGTRRERSSPTSMAFCRPTDILFV